MFIIVHVRPVQGYQQPGLFRETGDQHIEQCPGHGQDIDSLVAHKPVHPFDLVLIVDQALHLPANGGGADIIRPE